MLSLSNLPETPIVLPTTGDDGKDMLFMQFGQFPKDVAPKEIELGQTLAG